MGIHQNLPMPVSYTVPVITCAHEIHTSKIHNLDPLHSEKFSN
jgi:hypothetical protein